MAGKKQRNRKQTKQQSEQLETIAFSCWFCVIASHSFCLIFFDRFRMPSTPLIYLALNTSVHYILMPVAFSLVKQFAKGITDFYQQDVVANEIFLRQRRVENGLKRLF